MAVVNAKPFQWVDNPSPLTKVPSDFTLPQEMRPYVSEISPLPVIDMSPEGDNEFPPKLVEEIASACEKYGCFQVVNHGVSEDLCNDMLEAVRELMESPPEVKAELYYEGEWKNGKIFRRHLKTSTDEGKVMMWSEVFRHLWHPTEDFSHFLPKSPLRYREVMPKYAKEIGKLFSRLVSIISVSLGLDKDFIQKLMGENQSLRAQANYYPPCPNPETTLGLGAHNDVSTITILRQTPGVCGLQAMVDDKWVSVEPAPNSFLIIIGDQLQVLTNDRYKSVHHRAVVNRDKLRVTVAMFYRPDYDTMISPIEELLDEDHPPIYKKYRFKDFQEEHDRQVGGKERIKQVFMLNR